MNTTSNTTTNTAANTCGDWKTLPTVTTPIVTEYDMHYEKFSQQTSPTSAHKEALEAIAEEVDGIREENIYLHGLLDQRTAEIQDLQRMVQERDATIHSYENTNLYMGGVPLGTDILMQECEEAILADNGAAEESALALGAEEWASKTHCKGITINGTPCTRCPKDGSDFCGHHTKAKTAIRVVKKKALLTGLALVKAKKQAERDAKKAQKEAEKVQKQAERDAIKAKKEAEKAELKAKKEAERVLKKAERDANKAVKEAEKAAERALKKANKVELKASGEDTAKKTATKRATPPMALWQRDNKESISAQVKADTSGDKYMVIVGRIWKNLEEDVQLRYKELSKTEKEALDTAATSATA